MPLGPPPDLVWVRHNGQLHQLSALCPDTWPYSSAALHRWQADRPLDEPIVINNMATGTAVVVAGIGSSRDDPLYCGEMEQRPLPVCTCDTRLASD